MKARRQRALEALRDRGDVELAQGLLHSLDGLATAMMLVDENDHVVLANPRAADILGRSVAEIERSLIEDLIAPSDELRAEAAGGRAKRLVVRPDGRDVVLGYSVSVLGTFGDAEGPRLAIAFQDVSDVARLEVERDRLLKLAAVGDVMPSILHEVRNPLAAVVATVELLLEERAEDGELAGELHAILGEVRRAILNLDGIGIVGRSLRSARCGAVDMAILEVARLLEARARAQHVEIVRAVPMMPLLPFDPSVLRALVFNLVTNALHASREGGRIEVSARLDEARRELHVAVRDEGEGMSPEVLARCKELFFTTKRSGSGIGLALCTRVLEEAGGTLEIQSASRAGTTVSLRIPLDDQGRA